MRHRITLILVALCLFSPLVVATAVQQQKQKPAQPAPTSKVDKKPNTQPDNPATAQTKKAPVADNQWALIVGVSKYPGQIQSLGFPSDDAKAIKELLVSAAGFPNDHIRLLTDTGAGDEKATKQNILAAVDSFAPRVKPGHEVIVFLAGHGIARGLGTQAKSYFLPVDVDAQSKDSLERTAVDLEELARHLSALNASQFSVFIDACREDPFPGRGIKGNQMTDVMSRGLRITPNATRPAGSPPPTSIVFYACQVGERAYEDPQLKHGVFTYYILEGIREVANRPDGRVEAGYLANFLQQKVSKWSSDFGSRAKFPVEQTPMMVASEVHGPMVIVRMAQYASTPPSAPSKGSVVLSTSPKEANVSLNGQALGIAPIEKELQPGEYTVRAEGAGFQPTETKITVVAGVQQELTITLKPTATNASYEKGVQFENQKLWPQAIASYEQALREDPSSIATYDRLASAYVAGGRYRDAVDLYTTASEKMPDNADILARRSRALSQWAAQDETQDPSTNTRPSKAIKWKEAGKESVRTAELAAKKAPDAASTNLALGFAYTLEERDRPKAVTAFVKATTAAPDDAEGYYGAGYAYRLMKQYQQAIPQLNKALELRSDYYEAHRELAYCYHADGSTDQAIKEYNYASAYPGETSNSGEMAGNHLALSALYTEKGQQVGGPEGQSYTQAGKGHETDARGYDPTLRAALKILNASGVSYRMTAYLPSELRGLINTGGVSIPGTGGGVKLPFPRRKP